MTAALVIIGLMALQRLGELAYARRNTRLLLARGAIEVGRAHYPLIVLLHASWLVAVVVMLPPSPPIHWPAVAALVGLQALRLWVIVALGPYWTTRIVTLPEAPLVRGGPYRFLRHPNYAVVVGEIAILPLAFGQVGVAIVFSVLNAAVLWWRIRIEDRALRARRELPGG
jgi:methyltransferase